MEDVNTEEILGLTGCTREELAALTSTDFGQRTINFVVQWARVTTQSLKANRLVLSQCLITEDEHILCRFCGEGIPNWQRENAREHTSDCPMIEVSEALIACKNLKESLNSLENETRPISEIS